ncbi:MAG: hypothetical protein ACO1OB_04040 [Archangium sp.]
MFRTTAIVALTALFVACGPPKRPMPDAGEEVDAGMMEVDAGRVRGDDPPTGWQMVAELPASAAPSSKLGVSAASAPDQFAQPMVAALYEDPNGDLNFDDNRVVFTRWDGVAKAFTELKTIEVVGGSLSTPNSREISIARDASTGRIVIAYVKPQANTIRLAVSDDEGANFSLSTVDDEIHAALDSNPSVAAHDGVIHLAFLQGSSLFYRTKTGSAAWVDASPAGISVAGRAISLAVDSAGNAGVAFFAVVNATSADLAFWRVGGSATAIASADMFDVTVAGREPSVSLTFQGTTPHLAYHLAKSDAADATQLWYLKSTDTGTTWAAPVAIPRNSNGAIFHSTQWYQAIAVEADGKVSVAAPWSALGTQTNCNGPKLARSNDGLSFMTCSPVMSPVQRGGDYLSLWSHRAGKLTLIFFYDSRTNPSIKPGLVMWREL